MTTLTDILQDYAQRLGDVKPGEASYDELRLAKAMLEARVEPFLDASTGYLTEGDRDRLQEIVDCGDESARPLRVIGHEYGWWVHVHLPDPDDPAEFASWQEAKESLRLSAGFWRLLDEAAKRGCFWLNLDADGDADLDLPIQGS